MWFYISQVEKALLDILNAPGLNGLVHAVDTANSILVMYEEGIFKDFPTSYIATLRDFERRASELLQRCRSRHRGTASKKPKRKT